MENKKIKLKKIKCSKCNYEWETKSELGYVSCPSCLFKTKLDQSTKKKEKTKQ